MVQLGIARDPDAKPAWSGGAVTGYISHAPDHRPLIGSLFGQAAPKPLMLVADTPPPGLDANAAPPICRRCPTTISPMRCNGSCSRRSRW